MFDCSRSKGFTMSILRLAIVVLITAVVNNATFAQECAPCNNSQSACGCANNNKQCLSPDELWAGFAGSQGCKGCVKMNKFRPEISGLGGLQYCGEGRCVHRYSLRVPVPSFSVNWPRSCQAVQPQQPQVAPEVTPEPECDDQSKASRPFGIFGRRPKQVRNDIPNDHFGKLGESRTALKFSTITVPKIKLPTVRHTSRNLPSAINGSSSVSPALYVNDNTPGPPKPVIESEELDRVEFARHLDSNSSER